MMPYRPENYRDIADWHEDNPGECPACPRPSHEGMLCLEHKRLWQKKLRTDDDADPPTLQYLLLVQMLWDKHRAGPCAICNNVAEYEDYLCSACRD